MSEEQTISYSDITSALKCDSIDFAKAPAGLLDHSPLTYRESTKEELEEYLLNLMKRMQMPSISRTTEENLAVWEMGWGENLELLKSGMEPGAAVTPKYFREGKFLRYDKKLVVSENLNLEHDLLKLCRYAIFQQFLKDAPSITEIGCGSCQNVWVLSQIFPDKPICGLDWTNASVDIINELASSHGANVSGRRFDMMNPGSEIQMESGGGIVTIHALEQVGSNHGALIDLLLRAKPSVVVHYEPILEFYDEDNLLDYMALLYTQKRNYLNGFATALRDLAAAGKIEMLADHRPYIGGVVHEASLLAWRPV